MLDIHFGTLPTCFSYSLGAPNKDNHSSSTNYYCVYLIPLPATPLSPPPTMIIIITSGHILSYRHHPYHMFSQANMFLYSTMAIIITPMHGHPTHMLSYLHSQGSYGNPTHSSPLFINPPPSAHPNQIHRPTYQDLLLQSRNLQQQLRQLECH